MRLTKTKTSKDQAARFSPSPEGKELETSHFCPKRSVALAKSNDLMQKCSFKAKLEAGTKYLPMVEMTSSYARWLVWMAVQMPHDFQKLRGLQIWMSGEFSWDCMQKPSIYYIHMNKIWKPWHLADSKTPFNFQTSYQIPTVDGWNAAPVGKYCGAKNKLSVSIIPDATGASAIFFEFFMMPHQGSKAYSSKAAVISSSACFLSRPGIARFPRWFKALRNQLPNLELKTAHLQSRLP